MVQSLLRSALWAGIPYGDVGGLTPEDIHTAVDVKTEKLKDFYRMLAWFVYNGATLTAVGLHNPKNFPTLEDAFPTFFEKREQQDWWVMKQRMEDYAKAKRLRT